MKLGKLYILKEHSLEYKPLNTFKLLGVSLIVVFVSLLTGMIIGSNMKNEPINYSNYCDSLEYNKNIVLNVGSPEWKDSVFSDYERRADLYLSRDEFEGTPLKGGMMALAAYNAYDSTGIFLPVELALAQCQNESSMGLKGRSPINNPYNVGEFDSGTVIWFDNTFEGVQAYYYLMCENYLYCKGVKELLKNFTNCNGKRYASNPHYEYNLINQIIFIKNYIYNHES